MSQTTSPTVGGAHTQHHKGARRTRTCRRTRISGLRRGVYFPPSTRVLSTYMCTQELLGVGEWSAAAVAANIHLPP